MSDIALTYCPPLFRDSFGTRGGLKVPAAARTPMPMPVYRQCGGPERPKS